MSLFIANFWYFQIQGYQNKVCEKSKHYMATLKMKISFIYIKKKLKIFQTWNLIFRVPKKSTSGLPYLKPQNPKTPCLKLAMNKNCIILSVLEIYIYPLGAMQNFHVIKNLGKQSSFWACFETNCCRWRSIFYGI